MSKFVEGERVVVVPHRKTIGGYDVGKEGTIYGTVLSNIGTIKVHFDGFRDGAFMYVYIAELKPLHTAHTFDPQIASDYIAITNLPPLK